MTRPKDIPQRLPQEVEFKLRANDLSEQIKQIEKPHDSVYFLEGDEMFGLHLVKHALSDVIEDEAEWELEISPYRNIEGQISGSWTDESGEKKESLTPYKNRTFYHPPIDLVLAGMDKTRGIYGSKGNLIDSVRGIDDLLEIVRFMNGASENGFKTPISDQALPDALTRLVKKVRELSRMKFEYAKPEFYRLLRNVQHKARPVKQSKEQEDKMLEDKGYIIFATTGWVEVERDGEKFELKAETRGMNMNGGWNNNLVTLKKRGSKGTGGIELFSEYDLWDGGELRNVDKLNACIETLELLDEALQASESVSAETSS